MGYHDDLQIPEPEGGYCPDCLDVAMNIVGEMRTIERERFWAKCPVCERVVSWAIDAVPMVRLPMFGEGTLETQTEDKLR